MTGLVDGLPTIGSPVTLLQAECHRHGKAYLQLFSNETYNSLPPHLRLSLYLLNKKEPYHGNRLFIGYDCTFRKGILYYELRLRKNGETGR